MDEQTITFTDEDAKRIHHPHDDVIVITFLIADYTTRRVLVDNKRSEPSVRNQQYTPLNVPLEQVLMQIKEDSSLNWPEKMKGDPNKRISIVTSIETMGMIRTSVSI